VWHRFDGTGSPDPLPPERRRVLVQISPRVDIGDRVPAIAVGYLRYGAGDLGSPYFVVPSFGRVFQVIAWCDCLPDDLNPPEWGISLPRAAAPAKTHAELAAENQRLRQRLAFTVDEVSSLLDKLMDR
jgi:hypothetical protein